MVANVKLFVLLLLLGGMITTQSVIAGEHPTGATGGLPEGHPSIAQMDLPSGHPGAPAFPVQLLEFPTFQVAVLEGTLDGDIDALFNSMFIAAEEQGLFNEETSIGAVFPFAMSSGWADDSVILVGVSMPEGAEIVEPLEVYDIPGGEYLMVMHIGPYENTEESWKEAYTWAGEHGINFGTGPAFERYLDDPGQVAAEELRTEIYLPLIPGQGHEGMDFTKSPGAADHPTASGRNAGGTKHPGQPPFNVDSIEIEESFQVAYIAGTLGPDMEALFMEMVGEAMKQGLLTEETNVGAVYPTLLTEGYQGEDTVVYAAISLPGEFDAIEPFKYFDIPAGEYLYVQHIGSYDGLGDTWEATFAWAASHGIQFGTGPALEHYLSDPMTTPEDELITEIMIPLVPGQKHLPGESGAKPRANPHGEQGDKGNEQPTGQGENEHPK